MTSSFNIHVDNNLTFSNDADATLSVAASTGTTAGKNLTIVAGSSTTGTNNINGGNLTFSSGSGDGTGTSAMIFNTKVNGTDAAAERMRIHTNGNVGIGTDSPASILHLSAKPAAGSVPYEMLRLENIEPPEYNNMVAGQGPSITFYVPEGDQTTGIGGQLAVVRESGADSNSSAAMTFWTAADDASVTEKMRITSAGNVGIGTDAPSSALHVHGIIDYTPDTNGIHMGHISGDDNRNAMEFCGDTDTMIDFTAAGVDMKGRLYYHHTSHYMSFYTNQGGSGGGEQMRITAAGNVGIGTSSPAALLHVSGWVTQAGAAQTYFAQSFTNLSNAYSSTVTTSILTTHSIVVTSSGNGFFARSDSRVKKNITELDDNEALEKLRLLKPCKYNYINVIEEGSDDIYGFIAQEVKDVLPYAVKTSPPDYLPNVYKGGTYNNNNITLSEPHGLTENGNIELLITTTAKRINCPYTIINDTTLNIDTTNLPSDDIPSNDPLYDENGTQLEFNIFVFGTLIDEPLVLNKDSIWTVATAALQEVDRQLQAEKTKVVTLETQVADLLARMTALENP